jgi:hypothetical protein
MIATISAGIAKDFVRAEFNPAVVDGFFYMLQFDGHCYLFLQAFTKNKHYTKCLGAIIPQDIEELVDFGLNLTDLSTER